MKQRCRDSASPPSFLRLPQWFLLKFPFFFSRLTLNSQETTTWGSMNHSFRDSSVSERKTPPYMLSPWPTHQRNWAFLWCGLWQCRNACSEVNGLQCGLLLGLEKVWHSAEAAQSGNKTCVRYFVMRIDVFVHRILFSSPLNELSVLPVHTQTLSDYQK